MTITLETLGPGDSAWLLAQHRDHYARAEGFDESFGALVARILADFEAGHDPTRERAFIAWTEGRRLGSVFCMRRDDETAQLRLFLLVPEARGRGLGRRMLAECMGFARQAGYRRMVLWTHESHAAAGRLYAAAGWRRIASAPVTSFGVDLVEQSWEIDL